MSYFKFINFVLIFFSFNSFSDGYLQESLNKDFCTLSVGKDTKRWDTYLVTKEDHDLMNRYISLYEKNKNRMLLNLEECRIPKIIHFIWLGPKNFPLSSIKNVRTWVQTHPEWEIIFWTDRKRPPPCSEMIVKYVQDFNFVKLKDTYEKATNWGEKSDILRYEILLQMGGVYLDHEASCIRSIDPLINGYDFFAEVCAPYTKIDDMATNVSNSIIGSKKNHPVLKSVLDYVIIKKEIADKKYPENTENDIRLRVINSSYISLTHAVNDMIDKDNNIDIVLPEVFLSGHSDQSPVFISKYCAATWIHTDKDSKSLKNIRKKATKLLSLERKLLYLQSILFVSAIFIFMYRGKK